MRGRKPKPTALKLVAGNPGRRKLNAKEAKPKRVIPAPPAHLTPAALVAWGSLSKGLDRLGLLTEIDALALEQLCEDYVEIVELRADVAANGRFQTVTTQSGDKMERTRPAATQLADAERRFRAMLAEFGMTPSSRSRVTATPEDASHSDPAAAYGL
jgi:P27 family predicted phage terminase small subunit